MAALLNIGFFTVPDKVARLTQGSAFTLQIASLAMQRYKDEKVVPDLTGFQRDYFEPNLA
jgi:hypothetical protein